MNKIKNIFFLSICAILTLSTVGRSYYNSTPFDEAMIFGFHAEHRESLTEKVQEAVDSGVQLILIADGQSGVYLIPDVNGEPLAVFKPSNESPGSSENPKGKFVSRTRDHTDLDPLKDFEREVFAYLLDRDHFLGVPETCSIDLPGTLTLSQRDSLVTGSLQAFIPNIGTLKKGLQWKNRALLPCLSTEDAQKIAVLDIRILNLDRNRSNILIDANRGLHPIDHALSMPNNGETLKFSWLLLEQCKKPVLPSIRDYIMDIDLKEARKIVKKHKLTSFDERTLSRQELATILLKEGVKKGLTLYDIGVIMLSGVDGSEATDKYHWRKPGYDGNVAAFEALICQPILEGGENPLVYIDEIIEAYIITHPKTDND